MNLDSQVSQLNRVGETVAKQLSRLGIETVQDLLFYYPFRYEDYSQIVPIGELEAGKQVTVLCEIVSIKNKFNPRTRRSITEAKVKDDSDVLRVVWFNQSYIAKNLKVGDIVYLSGKVVEGKSGITIVSPGYERPSGNSTTHTARIVPIYPLTSGISQKQLRFLVSQVVDLSDEVKDWVPDEFVEKADIMKLSEAIKLIHFPENNDDIKHAIYRLKFDELFILQLRAEMIFQSLKRQTSSKINFDEEGTRKFVSKLPFELTKDQKVVAWEILQDLKKTEPMNRLLQGDVGSGKTVVAGICANNAVLNNFQVVLMAPTEVLASQHYESFKKLFNGAEVKIALYTKSLAQLNFHSQIAEYKSLTAKKKFISNEVKENKVGIIIGTHALLSENVEFHNLGLVIVDEQQRFGVEQRKAIREKSGLPGVTSRLPAGTAVKTGNKKTTPHFLSMTATPIPRSFALTVYGDLSMSIIKGLPPGRKAIITKLVSNYNRNKAYDFIRGQVKKGRQVFVVCPLIDNEQLSTNNEQLLSYKNNLEKKSVMSEYKKLSKEIFPDLKIEYLHGKMKSKEKDEVMRRFSGQKVDILVSTSVIEVGVDMPNASVMMIEGADRFGLAQLHQFRGRVGRSSHQSYCFLFTQHHFFSKKSGAGFTDNKSTKAIDRLRFFEKNSDGFKLAEFDLAQRGPGEVYGAAQSGILNFRFASMRDTDIIKLAREFAHGIDFKKYPSLKEKVKQWESMVHLE